MTEPTDSAALREELAALTTESSNPRYTDLAGMDTASLLTAMNTEDAQVPAAVSGAIPAITAAVDRISRGMARGGRLIYVGAGTPGRIGILDASECPPTFGTDPGTVIGVLAGGTRAIQDAVENAEDDAGAAAADLAALALGPDDSVVGLSASGRTPYVLAAVERARRDGAFTVGFACNAGSPLAAAADLALEVVVGPEFLAGSTRLKSGTAQKLVLNMISTATMVRLGKTYRNLMVDLRATNDKLRARSERALMQATGCDAATAAAALAGADGWVKAAILVLETGIAPEEAAAVLAAHHGHLSDAIEDIANRPAR